MRARLLSPLTETDACGVVTAHTYDDLGRLVSSQVDGRVFDATFDMYAQQQEMLANVTHVCTNRIVSIFQPHIRPIVRDKAKAKVEFGAKIGVSIYNGYSFVDHHSWNAYNESSDLELHTRLFEQRFGCLPVTILADKIYMNKANRNFLKANEIKTYSKPLGRPPKEPRHPEYYDNMAKAIGDRNEVECSFGTGKRIYRADNIRAKLPNTAECWTEMCYFVKNVMKFLGEFHLRLFEKIDFWLHIIIFGQELQAKILQSLYPFIISVNTI